MKEKKEYIILYREVPPSEQALYDAVKAFLIAYPGEPGIRDISESCHISFARVHAWSEGKELADPSGTPAMTESIGFLLFYRSLEHVRDTVPGYVRKIAHKLGVSFPTVQRWLDRVTEPHPAMLPGAIKAIRSLLPKRRRNETH